MYTRGGIEMTEFKSLELLPNSDQLFIQQMVSCIQTILNQNEKLTKKRGEHYLDCLRTVEIIISEHELTYRKTHKTYTPIHDDFYTYLQTLKKLIFDSIERELVSNASFRTKNLRGAKVEDLYFYIHDLVHASLEDLEPFQGMINGHDILRYVELSFQYEPILKQEKREENEQ